MAQLIRFKIDNVKYKVRLFERSSRRGICACCGDKGYGVLIRHSDPKKIPDTMVCGKCIVLISLGIEIKLDRFSKFGPYSESSIIKNAHRRKKRKTGRPPLPKPKVAKKSSAVPVIPKVIRETNMETSVEEKCR